VVALRGQSSAEAAVCEDVVGRVNFERQEGHLGSCTLRRFVVEPTEILSEFFFPGLRIDGVERA
jgi:hypothetical protein